MLRYRRSLIGPFWLTLSMGIMVGTVGLIYGQLFKVEASSYLPYLTVGLLVWGLISSCISDGCQTFIEFALVDPANQCAAFHVSTPRYLAERHRVFA